MEKRAIGITITGLFTFIIPTLLALPRFIFFTIYFLPRLNTLFKRSLITGQYNGEFVYTFIQFLFEILALLAYAVLGFCILKLSNVRRRILLFYSPLISFYFSYAYRKGIPLPYIFIPIFLNLLLIIYLSLPRVRDQFKWQRKWRFYFFSFLLLWDGVGYVRPRKMAPGKKAANCFYEKDQI